MRKIIRTNYLFDGNHAIQKGHLVINGAKIEKVAFDWDYPSENVELIKYDENFVMPGLFDNHVFFSGYLRMNAGVDLSTCQNVSEAVAKLAQAIKEKGYTDEPLYGHSFDLTKWPAKPTQADLEQLNYAGPIATIDCKRSYAWLNGAAKDRYGFDETGTSAEAAVVLIKELLNNQEQLQTVFAKFEQALLEKGVVAIKEIVFDEADYFAQAPERRLQTNFYIQAVAEKLNIPRLVSYQSAEFPSNIHFGGAKIMVDGVVADETGATNGEYLSGQAQPEVNYHEIEEVVTLCSQQAIPCCLTTEGDLAAEKAAEILTKNSKRLPEGRYHSMSDLEMVSQKAATIMASGQVAAEIYPQVLGLNDDYATSYMLSVLPAEYQPRFFDYRTLAEAGVLVTSGTDLPLFITDLPESILRAVWRVFPEGEQTWQKERGLDLLTLLQSFTKNAYGANGQPDAGVLQAGAPADLAVFNCNLATENLAELKTAKVIATYLKGEVAFKEV